MRIPRISFKGGTAVRKIIEESEREGLDVLLGENVLLLCGNYFYHGRLVGVNDTCVKLENASIVFEMEDVKNECDAKMYKESLKLSAPYWYVQRSAIESFGVGL
jgi:hypothetical protein